MPNRRGAIAVLAAVVITGGAVAAGVFLTRGAPEAPVASATAAPTTAPVGSDLGLEGISPTPTASVGPDPYEGQEVATDEPVVATGSEVPIVVTFAGYDAERSEVQVGGYVAGVIEEGGSCTLTLTQGESSVTGQTQALPDASTTTCGAVVVPGDQVSPGTWQAVLSYRSAEYSGTSEAWDVEVPQ